MTPTAILHETETAITPEASACHWLALEDHRKREHDRFILGEIAPDAYNAWVRVNLMPDQYLDAARCSWCHALIFDDEELVKDTEHDYDGDYHELCLRQHRDEEQLREFLGQIARDCAEKIREWKSLHPTRAREHKASSLLARLELTIAAAVR